MSGSDPQMTWKSPLQGHAAAGRFGNPDAPLPGVRFDVIAGRDVVRVSPFNGKRTQANAALCKKFKLALPAVGKSSAKSEYTAAWAALDAWYVMAPGAGRGALHATLAKALRTSAAVVDQTHGVTGIRVSGHRCRDLLAKGCPVDLDPALFPVGACAATQMEHTTVHLRRSADEAYELLVPTSQVASFWHFLTEMALEFGYEVGPQ